MSRSARGLITRIGDVLAPEFGDVRTRDRWLRRALADSPELRRVLDVDGDPAEATDHIVLQLLLKHGEPGRQAVLNLLEDYADRYPGMVQDRGVDVLVAEVAEFRPGGPAVRAAGPARMGDGWRPKLFISYRRTDWPFTQRLKADLEQRYPSDIFMDLDSVDEADFERSIMTNLKAADVVLVVVSEATFAPRIRDDSDWVRREIALALDTGKSIALACIGSCGLPTDLPEDIRDITRMQGIQFYPEPELWDGTMRRLAAHLEQIVKPGAATGKRHEGRPRPAAAPTRRSNPETLQEALRHLNAGNYDEAIPLLTDLQSGGYRLPLVDDLLAKATAARDRRLREQEAQAEYEVIDLLLKIDLNFEQARMEWQSFVKEFPEFGDPADIADRVKTPQQRTLDVILDAHRPPQERAEAGRELARLGDDRPGVGRTAEGLPHILWVPIPAGKFIMGSDKGSGPNQDPAAHDDETPRKTIDLPALSIARFPTTVAQFRPFVEGDGYANPAYWTRAGWGERGKRSEPDLWQDSRWAIDNHPVVGVSWYEAAG